MALDAVPITSRPARTQADRLLRHCVYMIATAKWGAGERLPSIREMRRIWKTNQAAVQQAYGRLEEMGLAESRPRSGWYVTGRNIERLAQHRSALEVLHNEILEAIRERTSLSPLGVLRYLAEVEAIRCREVPEVAFVECTVEQARGHAEEISSRFGVPVLALTTEELAGQRSGPPEHVRHLLTSSFHLQEMRRFDAPPSLRVTAVPIEIAPSIVEELEKRTAPIVLLEQEESMAEHIATDTSRLLGGVIVEVRLVDDPSPAVRELVARPNGSECSTVLLSPRLWGQLDSRWREHPDVHLVTFEIPDAAWSQVADAIGVPVVF